MYNCVGSTALGSSTGDFLEIRPGLNKGWYKSNPVGMIPGGTHVAYLGNNYVVRYRE